MCIYDKQLVDILLLIIGLSQLTRNLSESSLMLKNLTISYEHSIFISKVTLSIYKCERNFQPSQLLLSVTYHNELELGQLGYVVTGLLWVTKFSTMKCSSTAYCRMQIYHKEIIQQENAAFIQLICVFILALAASLTFYLQDNINLGYYSCEIWKALLFCLLKKCC